MEKYVERLEAAHRQAPTPPAAQAVPAGQSRLNSTEEAEVTVTERIVPQWAKIMVERLKQTGEERRRNSKEED